MDEQAEFTKVNVYTRSALRADEGTLLTAPSSIARVRAEVVSFVRQRADEADILMERYERKRCQYNVIKRAWWWIAGEPSDDFLEDRSSIEYPNS